jgi:hypothetical protein
VIAITPKACSFTGTVKDDRRYDSGIDSVLVDSLKNINFHIDPFNIGDQLVNFSGDLIDQTVQGYVFIRIKDVSGNLSSREIKILPNFVGFDSTIEVTPGKQTLIPLKFINLHENQSDSNFSFTVEFDSTSLIPKTNFLSLENSQSSAFEILSFEVKGTRISSTLSGRGHFQNGALINLNFQVKENALDSTRIILEDFKLNDDKQCFNKINSIIKISRVDTIPPAITLTRFGNKFFGKAVDSAKADKGISSISLYYSQNAKLSYSQFRPGSNIVEFVIECKDSLKAMNGVLSIMDGGGNITLKYFENNPIIIGLDTVRAQIFENIIVTPIISAPLYDSVISRYEYKLKYDTSVIRLAKPFFDFDNIPNNNFTIKFDSSLAGIIYIKGSGASTLRKGGLINLHFIVQPGLDTISTLSFQSFKIDDGEKFVVPRSGSVIRYSNDKQPPEIITEQKRNAFAINIYERKSNDIGIQSVVFEKPINFIIPDKPNQVNDNINRYYLLQMQDTTKDASISITARDFSGNSSLKEIQIKPIRLSFPAITFGKENEIVSIPVGSISSLIPK